MLFDKQKIAITSEATVISKLSSLGIFALSFSKFIFIFLSPRSFKSTTLFQTIFSGSIFSLFPSKYGYQLKPITNYVQMLLHENLQ